MAAIGIISTRCLDLLMIFNLLGVRGVMDFIHRSVQTWSLTLIFFASLVLLCIEFRCAFVILQGRAWGRWVFLLTQIIATGYLWAASLGWGYPELFSIAGGSRREIFHSLVMQKTARSAGAFPVIYSRPQPTFFPTTVILRRDRIAGPRFS
ncbi:putative inner membrane protein [Cronobacter dublinensis 1210]|uniref:Inner membrane protein n=1 Tax=Cronobacter dublinensis 1210 TaxID=1208656 RepID=A0ABM9Q8S4_9ENTR|nr:putative inner membrane protein [Cronobacter dublinensis 1210]